MDVFDEVFDGLGAILDANFLCLLQKTRRQTDRFI